MQDLKFTTINDIHEFLAKYNYKWNGTIKENNLLKIATIEDFEGTVWLRIQNDNTDFLGVVVDDTSFFIEDPTLNKKFNFKDMSLLWRTFMIPRKSKAYARFIYTKIKQDQIKIENDYTEKLNLIKKETEKLKFERAKANSFFNTTILNLETKLTKFEMHKLNKRLEMQQENNID